MEETHLQRYLAAVCQVLGIQRWALAKGLFACECTGVDFSVYVAMRAWKGWIH